MRCPKLREYIPFGTGAKRITRDICKDCLGTGAKNDCHHYRFPNWRDYSCPVTKWNILICNKCDHKKPQEWMKNNFNPRIGKHNFTNMIKKIGNDKVLVNAVRVDSNQTSRIQIQDQRRAIQQDQNQHCSSTDIEDVTDSTDHVQVQAVLVNHMKIGRAGSPYEVIRVRTKSGIYPVTIIYDTGSQLTICNYKARSLVIGEKITDRRVTIATVNSAKTKLRKIYTLSLKEDIKLDAILMPDLDLNLQSMKIPEQWEDLDEEFADQDTSDVRAQILIGADRAILFPTDVKNPDGTIVETKTCRLVRSRITGWVIMFGAGEDHDHEDYEEEMEVDKEEGSCNQVYKDTHQVSALASTMDGLAITSIDNISLADNE